MLTKLIKPLVIHVSIYKDKELIYMIYSSLLIIVIRTNTHNLKHNIFTVKTGIYEEDSNKRNHNSIAQYLFITWAI